MLFTPENYHEAQTHWPKRGKVILAQVDEASGAVAVYQAFNDKIADWAVEHQRFRGCPTYNSTRCTWIKTNFLWMMFRSRWAGKKNQSRVLCIWLKRDSFLRLLRCAREKGAKAPGGDNVRLQWDPDKYHDGSDCLGRRAIQLGLKNVASFADGSDIHRIEDITAFVHEQGVVAQAGATQDLLVARERVFPHEFS